MGVVVGVGVGGAVGWGMVPSIAGVVSTCVAAVAARHAPSDVKSAERGAIADVAPTARDQGLNLFSQLNISSRREPTVYHSV